MRKKVVGRNGDPAVVVSWPSQIIPDAGFVDMKIEGSPAVVLTRAQLVNLRQALSVAIRELSVPDKRK